MKVLILGGGGREHALAWKIAQSPRLEKLFIAPGNAGTADLAVNVALSPTDFEGLREFCLTQSIGMLIVGPEAPLVAGVVDYFRKDPQLQEIRVIGPDKAAAQLEGSKEYSKKFMERYGVPTAAFRSFTASEKQEGFDFLETIKAPYVLKADGLAAGKGVVILSELQEAKRELETMLEGKFGQASERVLIEEYLEGREFSVFAITDGKSFQLLPVAKDYKRVGEGDTGLNTGGMGAVSPVTFVDDALMAKVHERIVKPTTKGLKKEKFNYKGFLFFGLIEVKGEEPYVIEYNVRLGDPETEVVLPRLKSDLLSHLQSLHEGELAKEQVEFHAYSASTVFAISEGYPESYEKGKLITGLDDIEDATLFHAGTKFNEGGEVVTSGGRVICVTGMGKNSDEALARSYSGLKMLCYEGIQYRKDIGYDL